MEVFKAILLGILQGITEFLPISSTAHLIVFPWIFGWEGQINTLTFGMATHGGTLLALILCFYRDWLNIFLKQTRLLFYILIATIPAGLLGLLFNDLIEDTLRNPLIIIITLIFFGILMLLAEKFYKKASNHKNDLSELTFKDSFFIGLAQSIALIPGVSRSGITITAGLFRNLKRDNAARFSFLLSTPIIAAATIFESKKFFSNIESYSVDIFMAGFLASFVSGFLAIKFLLQFFKKYSLNVFVYYRFLLAVIILIIYFNKGVS
jgi:undecaprenyl-diphosphatase